MVNTRKQFICADGDAEFVSTPASQSQVGGPGQTTSGERLAADARAAAFGRIIALLMTSPRHADMTLREAQAFVAPAIAHGQLAILGKQTGETGTPELAAAAWWAMVSPDVDERLTKSSDARLSLAADEWRSGDQPWIVETIGEAELINELVKRLAERTFTGKPAKLRAHLPDGRVAVGRIERKAPEGNK